MRIAFAVASLFPGGGLQRDYVDIARRVRDVGHDVTIFTSQKLGEGFAEDLPLQVLPITSLTNHQRQRAFSEKFAAAAASGHFDLRVGFDKLSNLDVLYCSDPSMQARADRNPLLHLLPRYRHYIALEKECFEPRRRTKLLLLSETQLNEYWGAWTTEPGRLVLLPPTLARARCRPEFRTDGTRTEWRARLGLTDLDWVWIAVGVQPKTKGFDRAIRALRRFSDARLLIVGLDGKDSKSAPIHDLARRLGVLDQIKWLGHHEDIPQLMAAADLFVHPARYDTTGTVILEAIVNGLPVITTSACGYAKHVGTADAGIVIQDPFVQRIFYSALETARDLSCMARWSRSGALYGKSNSLYDGKDRAAALIVATGIEKNRAGHRGPLQLLKQA
jgi:UDP-glucose:(heptosyl)LPS alpha-1,3-glucosyltransferase